MPARKFDDVEHFKKVQETTLAMLTMMHAGLSEIAKTETFFDESQNIKAIAESTLREVENIALNNKIGGQINA